MDFDFFRYSIKMEYQKIIIIIVYLDLMQKKWLEVQGQSGESYNINKQIWFKTSMLRSDICDYSDAYMVLKKLLLKEHIIKSAIMDALS